ncbi:helix-turn-helix domain-containing protein [Fodinicola acaciae]|uniref:helix-turn-helix domain-containing protein n=1 Tax=Fodinicola acaciae TaxID=2681555 RepID=UPI0013D23538|nr:hypothetical protein [Fodinicola acaciae]
MPKSLEVSRSTAAALVRVGGRFMTSEHMDTAAERYGMPGTALYFRGRIGAAGSVAAPVAVSLLGLFPRWVVEMTWEQTKALPAQAAVPAYVGALSAWSAERLAGFPGADRLVELAEKVIDRAEATALPLFAGWRAQSRPDATSERAAYALMLLRELRGGLHFAALRAAGLDVPLAVLGDPIGGLPRLRRTAWRPEDIEPLVRRADAMPDLRERWNGAEETTSVTFAHCLAVLAEDEVTELGELITAADALSSDS